MPTVQMSTRYAEPSATRLVSPADRNPMLGWAHDGLNALALWRERRHAAGSLRSFTDLQLRDLGIARVEIEQMVHGNFDASRRPRGGHD